MSFYYIFPILKDALPAGRQFPVTWGIMPMQISILDLKLTENNDCVEWLIEPENEEWLSYWVLKGNCRPVKLDINLSNKNLKKYKLDPETNNKIIDYILKVQI